MKLFLISIDVAVERLVVVSNVIKGAKAWWHHIENTWIIATNKSLEDWKNEIRSVIDDQDSFLIIEVTGCERNGWLPKSAWIWLRERNKECKQGESHTENPQQM